MLPENFDYKKIGTFLIIGIIVLGVCFWCLDMGMRTYGRWQARLDAENVVLLNKIAISQFEQKIQIEQQKKQIRIVEAEGIAASQKIINATLTDKYLQHEAIEAQKALADSPNHTTIYIPSGQNGLPLVKTVE
jgi:hypothetical protein